MFGDHDLRHEFEHLAALIGGGISRSQEALTAVATLLGGMRHHLVGMLTHFQPGTEVPRLATTRFAARFAEALGVRAVKDIRRRRFVAILAILVDLPFQVLNASFRGVKRLLQSQDCIGRRFRFGR